MSLDPANGPVILVEDDTALREATVQTLELSGFEVQPFESAMRAARYVIPSFAGCIITDIRMDGMDGLQLFSKIMEIDGQIPVILITGHGDISMAVRAMQDGAFDFLAKPFSADHLSAVVRKALNSRQLVMDNRSLRSALTQPADDMVAESRAMAQVRSMATQVARTDLDLCIEGEMGTGKEMLARRVWQQSVRHDRPFLVVPGATFGSSTELESLVNQTDGGTLFLDGCDRLTPAAQASLVALLDARDRARDNKTDQADFRLIASTPLTLPDLLDRNSLREDLFHRLSSITLLIPPLRERREDIPVLFAKFVRDALEQTGKRRFEMNAADRKRLLEHGWPGNARELRNYVFGAVLNLPRQALSLQAAPGTKDLATRISEFERMLITETLESTGGNVVRACALLGTPRKTLYEKLSRLQIDPRRFRSVQTKR
jgi:two-component system, NtrC family, C4-dicarboxylate transport response regulator DctD